MRNGALARPAPRCPEFHHVDLVFAEGLNLVALDEFQMFGEAFRSSASHLELLLILRACAGYERKCESETSGGGDECVAHGVGSVDVHTIDGQVQGQ